MNTNTTSTLTLKVNARDVNQLPKQLKTAFDVRPMRDFRGSIAAITKELREMRAAGQGALQPLVADSQTVAANLERAVAALRQLQASQGTASRGGAGGGGAGAGSGTGCGGTTGGGSGPSSLRMSTAQRQAQAQRGGGLADLPMPGMAAVQSAMGAMPLLGGVAAGSMMAAVGTYSSHLRLQNAMLQAAPFLVNSRDISGYKGVRKTRDAVTGYYVDSEGNPTTYQSTREEALDRMAPEIQSRIGHAVGDRLRGKFTATISGGTSILGAAAIEALADSGIGAGTTTRALATVAELTGNDMSDTYGVATRRTWVPGEAAQYTGAPVRSRDYIEAGRAYGAAPADAIAQASALSQAAAHPVSADTFESALAARQLFGVSMGASGGVVRGVMRAGVSADDRDASEQLAKLIGSAVARGLQGSDIEEYLRATSQALEEQVAAGRVVSIGQLVDMEERVARTTGSWRGAEAVRQFGAGGAEAMFAGQGDAASLALMRSLRDPETGAAWTGRGGSEEYARFRLLGQDAGVVAEGMPRYLAQFDAQGAGPNMRALLVQNAMRAMGAKVGPGEALRLSGGIEAEGFGDVWEGGAAGMHAPGRAMAAALGSSVIGEAGIEADRAGMGARMSSTVQAFERTTNNMAGAFENSLGPAVEKVSEELDRLTHRLRAATEAVGPR